MRNFATQSLDNAAARRLIYHVLINMSNRLDSYSPKPLNNHHIEPRFFIIHPKYCMI